MDSSLLPPSLPTSDPIRAEFSDVDDFAIEASEQISDLLTSAPFLNPSLPMPQSTTDAAWFEMMHLGELGPLVHGNLEAQLSSSRTDTPSTTRRLGEAESGSSQPAAACSCMELVHQELSAIEGAADRLYSIKTLRKSTEVAEAVLSCTMCFDINRKPSETSGNSQLLGSLLLAVAARYSKIFDHQQQKATESSRDASPVRLFLGHDAQESCLIELSLEGHDYWRLFKSGFRSELDHLSHYEYNLTLCLAVPSRPGRMNETVQLAEPILRARAGDGNMS
ncbi:hypothetical protein DL769_003993 [Monosporascus sp. CRB-8-3]|nr:hypothetical protein DL769_003993 [Monosporascus sp. CRB-8-3]